MHGIMEDKAFIPYRHFNEDAERGIRNWTYWPFNNQSEQDRFPFKMKHNKVKKMRRK